MFAVGLAVAAYVLGRYVIGAKGWLILLPLVVLLLINPAWGAAFFLAVLGIAVAGGILYLLIAFLPQIVGFVIGVWLVFMLIIGIGSLVG